MCGDPIGPVNGRTVHTGFEEAVDLPPLVDAPRPERQPVRVGERDALRSQLPDVQAELIDATPGEPFEQIGVASLRQITERHGGVQRTSFQ